MTPASFSLITTLLLILAAALGGGAIAWRLKQPLILGYIAGGIIVGNLLPRFVDHSLVSVVADAGVTLLLFTLGVEFSFHRLRKILGTVSWAAALQVVGSLLLFLGFLLSLGLPFIPSLFIASASALSSTAVVLKILSERGEIDTVPGEAATGWLVVQDLAVIPLMVFLTSISRVSQGDGSVLSTIGIMAGSLLKAGVILAVVLYLGRHGVPKLLAAVVKLKSRELFLLSTIGLVFVTAMVTYAFGLSAPLGAFIAGLLVAETSQNHAVFAEVRPLRDLFAVVFFVSLGMVLPLGFLLSAWKLIAGLTATVMVGKFVLILLLMRFLSYHRKAAFFVALSLTQVSEFGFIIGREGTALGALTDSDALLLTAVTFLTICISSPLMTQSASLFAVASRLMGRFPKLFADREEPVLTPEGLPIENHVVICGFGRVGKYIGRALEMAGIPFLVVDYNHATVRQLAEKGIGVLYGDPGDKDVLDFAQVDRARALVVAIPDRHTQELVIGHALSLNRRIKIICRTHHEEDQKHLKALGVHAVIQPEFEAAISIASRLLTDYGVPEEEITGKVSRLKIEHGVG